MVTTEDAVAIPLMHGRKGITDRAIVSLQKIYFELNVSCMNSTA